MFYFIAGDCKRKTGCENVPAFSHTPFVIAVLLIAVHLLLKLFLLIAVHMLLKFFNLLLKFFAFGLALKHYRTGLRQGI